MPASVLKRDEPPAAFTDKYDVERVIGRGGMGTVFEARHSRLGHRVAIKVLGAGLRAHPELVTRFEREARAAGALSSPHAVKVFDIDQTADGTPFIVMELLDGRDLAYVVERDGAQPIGTAVRWVIEACDAIAEAHRLGIIHRDIKPSNLLLCRESGSVKVLDFGIAKHSAATDAALTLGLAPLGTPQYMSPEQARCAAQIDARSDIWSLGVTLYELVCGRPPFNHEVPHACIAAIVADPIPDPRGFRSDLPDGLTRVILRALAKDPADRFASVEELVLALAPFADRNKAVPLDGCTRVFACARRTVVNEHSSPSERCEDDRQRDEGEPRRRPEEQSVPPAVPHANARTTRAKRIRSSLALGSAAVLGVATLIATPRCVGPRLDASATPPTHERTNPRRASSEPEPEPEKHGIAPLAPEMTSSSAKSLQPPLLPQLPRPVVKPTKPVQTTSPVKITGSDRRPIHGGISSPGF